MMVRIGKKKNKKIHKLIAEEEEEKQESKLKLEGGELLVYTSGICVELLAPVYSFEPPRS